MRFSKSAVWSEVFKGVKELEAIKPLLLGDIGGEKNQILKDIKDYFLEQAEKFLDRELE